MNTANSTVNILIAEDNNGHAELIIEQIQEAGVNNPIRRFHDGQEVIDFLFSKEILDNGGQEFLLLLDIRMPRMDGVEVLEKIKAHPVLRSLPVIMLTTTDDPREIERCYELGCNSYVTKPVEFTAFTKALRNLGLFLSVMRVPEVRGHG